MNNLEAYKMDGLGNDFVIFDKRKKSISLTKDQIVKISNRNNIGCDQVIFIDKDESSNAFLKFYNSDGGEISACGNGGSAWHSHEYAEDDPSLGFLRVFFYVNGFQADDGGLKVVRGSHLHRDAGIRAESDAELLSGWMADKVHPKTGMALAIEGLSVPRGTVVLMWTHAAHGVNGRKMESDTRWCVVYAYRNPGRVSRARWLSEEFEKKRVVGAEGLMSLY